MTDNEASASGRAMMQTQPDLSSRPHGLMVERTMNASCSVLYRAWTEQIDRWFAAPGTVAMQLEVGTPFFFETHFDGQRHPHYGRFLRLVPDQLIELTWVTGEPGTKGSETVLTITLEPLQSGSRLTLVHAGMPDEETSDGHEQAWPLALEILDQRMGEE